MYWGWIYSKGSRRTEGIGPNADTYHNSVPLLAARIAAKDGDTLGFDKQAIFAATSLVREFELV